MLVYEGTKLDFMKSIEEETIAKEIEDRILLLMNRHTVKNEFQAWENSLEYMYKVLNDKMIADDAGVAIEYNIPQTSKRVDFLISGYDNNDKENVIIIELKQWSELKAIDGREALVETYTGGGMRKVVHPSYQAWSYAQLIRDYNVNVQNDDVRLYPCACLHNYRRSSNDPLDNNQYKIYLDEAPAFTKGQVYDLRDFISKKIIKGDNKQILYKIENGKIKPSKSLQNEIASMLKGNQEFIMIDDQRVAYEEILDVSRRAVNGSKKQVVIVKGGPGTGKSVLAINLLSKLTNEDQFCQYVSKNSAPRKVYFTKLKGKRVITGVSNLFKGSASYVSVESNMIDTLLVDEAHRLALKNKMKQNVGENQIKEIINSAKCSVFFIDERQRVSLEDIGSIQEIKDWAMFYNAEVTELELVSQFRCNGSNGYLAWVDNTLDIRKTANIDMQEIDFDLRICDSPTEMYNLVVEKNTTNNCSRVLAGYCWRWPKKERKNINYHDIVIGDFEMSWNLDDSIFAISETSINEVGCIHTSQGLEFDYVGVIIGDDMRYENGCVITDFTKRASTDQSLKGIKKMAKENPDRAKEVADEIIKNTYRTLMTRGMKGCYVYCTNKELSEYLKSCIGRGE